jgi:PTH1 family peptidyl-tRNA hydrolase
MKVIALLGNPGAKYERTRHNAGWLFADYYAAKAGFSPFTPAGKWQGQSAQSGEGDDRRILFKPVSFMNRSGAALAPLLHYFRITPAQLLVVYDDKDLPLGTVRYRERGGSGGHRGMADIIQALGTEEIARVKIGVDHPYRVEHAIETADFVLSDFSAAELAMLREHVFPEVFDQVEQWLVARR